MFDKTSQMSKDQSEKYTPALYKRMKHGVLITMVHLTLYVCQIPCLANGLNKEKTLRLELMFDTNRHNCSSHET